MAQSGNGTVTHLADKNHMFFHAYLLQNSHIKTEQSFQLLGIWHKFSFQLVGIWHTMSFFIGWHTANTVDSTLGFFFPALSLTVKLIHSPLGFLAITADFHMQIFSACCKETEEHPHIFTSSSSQFYENWNGHARVMKMGMHVSSAYFPNSLFTKSCVGWAELQWPSHTFVFFPLLTIFHHNIAKEPSGLVMVFGAQWYTMRFSSRTTWTFEGKKKYHTRMQTKHFSPLASK